ncbi:ABC transporter ATP-binding protein [Paenibacillus sp. LHD-117]|uniref:ABC transporter ATP-binding protein n=1 Tax=Paenibacillus sp. LHD-117 TaxID=3071412 RepID=UPI0027DF7507|nr:ABC transporter ATP-binding protein [Paenibacillus sp. LHD-117]MDQ6419169.1 ABC transporter ATP-binding protein [Paenibacillus sp. LHD-117]
MHTTNLAVSALAANGRDRETVLHPVRLSIHRGEWVSLLGANGSGKSTLAKAIAGMPLDGVSGIVERRLSAERTAGGATPIVLQNPDAGLVGSSPWEDVVLMLEQWGNANESRIASVAEDALHSLRLGERMHQPIETLSGGQKQLTAIAGCLAASPELLILDEVTAMLDPDMSDYVLREVRRLHAAGTTVVWITQKMNELEGDDSVWVMSGGELVYEGDGYGFFRRSVPGAVDSPAESYGFEAPYAVQVGWELEAQGIRLPKIPLRVEQLAEAVNQL